MAGGDELLPIGQKGNYKKYIETATSSVVAEQVTAWLQPSTSLIGLLSASTAQIGHVVADLSTAKIGALQGSTESIGYVTSLVSTAQIGHVVADLSTAKIGALQASTESIGYVTALVSTAKIGALQASTESIGNVGVATIAGSTPSFDQADGADKTGCMLVELTLRDATGQRVWITANQHNQVGDNGKSYAPVLETRYNATSFDSMLNNHNKTVLASTSRTSDATSADQTNYNASAHILYLAYDTATGAALTPSLQLKDALSERYATVWTAAAAVSATTGLYTYSFDPAGSTASTGYTEVWRGRPGRTWRLVVTASSSGATQYSASVDNLVGG